MKIDKEQLRALADRSDKELWEAIGSIASSHGYTLPSALPKSEDMEKIRAALRGTEKINMREAVRLMNEYKRRGQDG